MWGFGRKTEMREEHLKLIFTTQEINWLLLRQGVHRFVYFKGQNCHSIGNNEYTEPLLYAVPDTKVPQHY